MRSIYILLTRTSTLFSRMISQVTGGEYTHVSISMDASLTSLYSFARRSLYFPLNAGFVEESLDTGVFGRNRNTPCVIYQLHVSEHTYRSIERYIQFFLNNKKDFYYNFLGILLCFMDIPYARKYHFFCSQFVAEVLENTGALRCRKAPSLMRPVDFGAHTELTPIYQGTLENYNNYYIGQPGPFVEEAVSL